jgi:hypothetical protein
MPPSNHDADPDDPDPDDPDPDDPDPDDPNPDDPDSGDPDPGDQPTLDSDDQQTPDPDRPAADRPICRVFGGPTSHRVQFAGPESRPATATDVGNRDRPPADESLDCDGELQTAGGRAIAAVLERRMAALERALDAVQDACWRAEAPDAADLREVRTGLDELQIAVEEYLARACPDTEPWESAGEHLPEARLSELLESCGNVPSVEGNRADRRNDTDSNESDGS